MHKVLVIDFSPYREEISRMLQEAGYSVESCESAFEAMTKLKAYDFDLIVSEVELPGDNAFDLYNYANTYYPYIPAVMITGKDIDTFFDRIFREGIGNVLYKPLRRDELLNLAEKLITKKNIFGLHNYLGAIDGEVKRIRIDSSEQIRKAIDITLKHIQEWGFTIKNRAVLNLILNELIINAVYHSHGYSREKEMRVPVQLKDDEHVDFCFARSPSSYGLSITDYKGKLSKTKVLDSINRAIEQTQLILRAAETGEEISDQVSETGRGIDLVRKLCAEYYFVIKKDVQTEVILIFDREPSAETEARCSLKIIEDAG
jgi:CheY-like chemotaxis protein